MDAVSPAPLPPSADLVFTLFSAFPSLALSQLLLRLQIVALIGLPVWPSHPWADDVCSSHAERSWMISSRPCSLHSGHGKGFSNERCSLFMCREKLLPGRSTTGK